MVTLGSRLTTIIVDLASMQLDTDIIPSLGFSIPIYYRYVDDILLSLPPDKINDTLQKFNSYHKRLKFTLELPTNNSSNFLDIVISQLI